ncbi:MAG: glycosyltransferase family 2 protein [Planctomycetota bacterium]|nr:MAG: glycosyltransferase family 2 protein [Planctomycetota bacterium]
MISAVIPVYNEGQRLTSCVDQLATVLRRCVGDDWEIVLVDDGSSDGTAEAIASLVARSEGRVRGLAHSANQGKGAAVRTGVLDTRGQLVMFCDADLSTPPETLERFMRAIEDGADVVVGNRKSAEARIERPQPALRTWMGLGFTRLANLMTGLSISDYTCGFKLFRGEHARQLFEPMQTPRWSFDVEVLMRAAQLGLDVREIPIRWSDVDDTRVRLLKDTVGSFLELLSIRRRLGRERPDRR